MSYIVPTRLQDTNIIYTLKPSRTHMTELSLDPFQTMDTGVSTAHTDTLGTLLWHDALRLWLVRKHKGYAIPYSLRAWLTPRRSEREALLEGVAIFLGSKSTRQP